MQQDVEERWIRIFRILTQTKKRKQYRGLLLFLFIGIAAFLTGCHSKDNFTVYRMETQEDNSELLYIDDVQYRRDWDGNELAMYYNGGDVWALADGLGKQIGVCGNGADSGGGFAIYEAAGDENHAVLYTEPRKYYFGGKDARLWLREDVSLGLPTAEMVSYITITCDKKEDAQTQTDDRILVEGLLDAYHSKSEQSVELPATDEQWIRYTFILHHKDYPFLQYEISGGYSLSQNAAYCCNDELEWFVLPEEWGNVFAILLTGYNFETQSQNQDTNTSIQKGTQAAKNTEDKYAYIQSAKMVPLGTKIQLDKNTLSYGKLQITLPDGVTIEEQKRENDMCVIDLIDMEKKKKGPFPPRIWIANYHVEYEDGRLTLISALLDLLPGVSLSERYTSGESCNLFTYYKPYKCGYILQYEDDIYLVEEIGWESNYSFGRLLDENAVQWKESTCAFGNRNRRSNQFYDKLNAAHDRTFLASQTVVQGRRSILLYRDGYFSTLYQNITYYEWDRDPVFEDRNFDGCLDIVTSTTSMYLWNAGKKVYEAAQIPEEFINQWHREFFPETKTIWSHDFKVMSGYDEETEILWKWEGAALVKQRECRAQVREKDVRLLAYESSSQNTLFDETFPIEAWEQNSINVQKRFEQFYAQMVPEGADWYFHTIDYNQGSYIPQALLDQLTNAMLDETESETLETLKEAEKYKILTKDEIFALAKDDLVLRCDVLAAEAWNDYTMIMADADNDGIPDIVAQEYFGGSAGFVEYVFYKGQEDGTYQKTSSYDAFMEAFSIISYDEKNYLCRTIYDYNKKTDNGLCIVCYVDGVQVQTAELTLFAKGYDVGRAVCGKKHHQCDIPDRTA